MKKILFIISLFAILVSTSPAFADYLRTGNGTGRTVADDTTKLKAVPTTAVRVTDNSRVGDLKQRADLEISRRIDALNKLITKINSFKRLSSAQKSDLISQVQTQINSLNTLKTKIDADTDISTLKSDVKSIVTNYRIYVFFIEDINLIGAAERIGTAIDNLTTLSGKLQTRIQDAQSKGSDVTSLNTKYVDMQEKLAAAKSLVDEVNSKLSGLTAVGYPANKTNLDDSRTELRTAFTDLKTAYQDGFQIIRILKELNLFPTLTPTPAV